MSKGVKEQYLEELKELKKMKGEERGADLVFLTEYLKKKEGEEGYRSLLRFLKKELDFELPDPEKLNNFDWIPAAAPHVFMVAMVRFFDWDDKEVFEMGRNSFTISRSLRILINYTFITKYNIKKALSYWNKFYTWGSAELLSFDKRKKEGFLCLRDFPSHPVVFKYLEGLFSRFLEISSGSAKAKVREVDKSPDRGKDDHVFKLTW